jgi:hypothetical protein
MPVHATSEGPFVASVNDLSSRPVLRRRGRFERVVDQRPVVDAEL